MVTWHILDSGPDSAASNMALDEALLEAMPRLQRPVLRFYRWTDPAASFGYFQKIAEVERDTVLRPLVRRPTGGGIVPHDNDWTYSLTFPPDHEWYALKATDSYRRVHEWIQMAFTRLGVITQLAVSGKKAMPGQCFAGFETSDVLWQGQKIAGAAQRRTRTGLLIQGSIQPSRLPPSRTDWQPAMCETAREFWGVNWMEFLPDPVLDARADMIAAEKYSQPAYNRKR